MAKSESRNYVKDETWYLEFGCNNHMIGTKAWFFKFDGNSRGILKLEDNSKMFVMEKGNVKLCIGSITYVIIDVYYLLGL